jgi:geranylgeranyl reductase family protein
VSGSIVGAGAMSSPRPGERLAGQADVLVVGAGPAGSTTAYHLAQAGLNVIVVEKTSFPREKVCGDGLTPRAVKQILRLGIDPRADEGWIQNHGLRILGGGMRLEIPWPDLAAYPTYGLVRTSLDFDEILARQARKAGATMHESTTVTGPLVDERTGRIVGVEAKSADSDPRDKADVVTYRAPVVVAADGTSSRLAIAMGVQKRDDRPMGVAVRTYFTSPRHDDDWLESWLELWDTAPDGRRHLLPGYGWIFGVGDGTSNVGLGILDTSQAFGRTDYKAMLRRWLASVPPEWQFTPEHQIGEIRGAALPMAFNRQPHYDRGLLLVGDAGGMINPCNGEGIAYAMEAGELAADVLVQAAGRRTDAEREQVLRSYPRTLKDVYGGYFTIGRAFVKAIGNPTVMKLATRHGLPHPTLMRFTLKLLANLTEPKGGDAMDRLINGLSRIAPAA